MLRVPGHDPVRVELDGALFVGRECAGIPESQRLVLDDEEVSRRHLELRHDAHSGDTTVLDTSTNGTRLNGARLERGVPVPVADGDRLSVGASEIEVVLPPVSGTGPSAPVRTSLLAAPEELVLVAGDIIGYSTVSELADSAVVSGAVSTIFGALRTLLREHGGSLVNFVGDALFVTWDPRHVDEAVDRALAYTLAAGACVDEVAGQLDLRLPDGAPLRMGWGVTFGPASAGPVAGSLMAVVGDATNVAFRLASLAGREGRERVLVTAGAHARATGGYRFGPAEDLVLKGRAGTQRVVPLLGAAA